MSRLHDEGLAPVRVEPRQLETFLLEQILGASPLGLVELLALLPGVFSRIFQPTV